MKPLPVQMPASGKPASESIPSLPVVLATPAGEYSKANRRAGACPVQRAYPWLLATSTAVAALFCLMYITKPVIIAASDATRQTVPSQALAMADGSAKTPSLMPSADRLPGETSIAANAVKPTATDPRRALPGSAAASAFEETNMRVQHVLTAEAPGGHLDKFVIDVPVLYQSRSLRWTPTEVAEARALLLRLMDYQEKSQALRSEGVELLGAWNHLIEGSIPSGDVRADSPSLPANQEDAADSPRPAGLITTESIQLQPSGK